MKELKLNLTQYRLLRKAAGGNGVKPHGVREQKAAEQLTANKLAYMQDEVCKINDYKGVSYLNHHVIQNGRIVSCERRNQLTYTTLCKDLRFTDKLINEYLPAPMLRPNPHYKSGAPMRLWYEDEVFEALNDPQLAAEIAAREKASEPRRKAAKKAVETKKAKTMRMVDIEIAAIRVREILPYKRLKRLAVRDRQDWYDYQEEIRGRYEYRDADSAPEDTKRRWMVNYVRHNLTDYDETLWNMKGSTGIREAYQKYRDAVLDAIAEAYPSLADECSRQKVPAWIQKNNAA